MKKIQCKVEERVFHFREPAGTSRGVYRARRSWLVTMRDGEGRAGIGECGPLPGLSCDDIPNYGAVLRGFCDEVERTGLIPYERLRDYPSMLFGLEQAGRLYSLKSQGVKESGSQDNSSWSVECGVRSENSSTAESNLTPHFTLHTPRKETVLSPLLGSLEKEISIPINGLVWMGTFDEMRRRVEEKLRAGFHCVKLKIGAIDWEQELRLIRSIRERYSREEVELRVDANGAFAPEEAMERLEQLARYDIHSIEQPIGKACNLQPTPMARLCRESPLPIALDEELIGVNSLEAKAALLDAVRPQYIVLKPSLHGGMMGTREWVRLARERGIGSWITSALESNVGLYAIALLAEELYGPDITMPQGLGTGQLFTDNIPMPLEVRGERLYVTVHS